MCERTGDPGGRGGRAAQETSHTPAQRQRQQQQRCKLHRLSFGTIILWIELGAIKFVPYYVTFLTPILPHRDIRKRVWTHISRHIKMLSKPIQTVWTENSHTLLTFNSRHARTKYPTLTQYEFCTVQLPKDSALLKSNLNQISKTKSSAIPQFSFGYVRR